MTDDAARISLFRSARGATTLGILLTLVLAAVLAGPARADWLVGLAPEAAFIAVYVLSAAALGDVARRRLIPDAGPGAAGDAGQDAGSEAGGALLAFSLSAALGLGALGLVTLGLGLAGWLSWGVAVGVVSVPFVVFAWDRGLGWRPPVPGRADPAGPGAVLWVAAAPLLAVALLAASTLPGFLWKPLDPHPYDVLSYHLQVPREWFEAGRVTPLTHNAFSYFPFGTEIHYLLMNHLRGGAREAMYAAQLLSLACLLLTAGVVSGTVRAVAGRLEVSPARASLAAAAGGLLTLATPWALMLGSVAYVETGLMLFTAGAVCAGVLAVVREAAPSDWEAGSDGRAGAPNGGGDASSSRAMSGAEPAARDPYATDPADRPATELSDDAPAPTGVGPAAWRWAALSGILAGLAGGVKYTAVPMVLLLVPLAAAVAMGIAGFGLRRSVGAAVVGLVAGMLAVSPWLVRNAAWTGGNPVFPLATGVFGAGHFTQGQIDRYRAAHSVPSNLQPLGARAAAGVSRTLLDVQFAYVLLPTGVLAAAGLLLSARLRAVGVLLTLFVLGTVAIWFFATHLVPRFITHALPVLALAAGLAALAVPRGGLLLMPAALGSAVLSLAYLATPVSDVSPAWHAGLLWLKDLRVVQPPELADALASQRPIFLVGNAQPFLTGLRPGQLRYRTVFDVEVPPGTTLEDGWLGTPIDRLREQGWVVIDPSELDRLHRTYRHLPAPSYRHDRPGELIVLPPTR